MSSPMAEMLAKTQCVIVGIVKAVETQTFKSGFQKTSASVEVKGTKAPIEVVLPEDFDCSKLQVYELCKLNVLIKPHYKNQFAYEVVAI